MAASSLKSQPAITLYRGFPATATYTWSPFVNKLEARFRFQKTPYKIDVGSPLKAPRGKVPYIKIENPGTPTPTMKSDSGLIIHEFVEDGLWDDLNASLSPVEKAQDLMLKALLEDKLYFYQVYERWHLNYYTMRSNVLAAIPYPIQLIVGLIAYRKIASFLHGQGTMRFTPEEIAGFRREIWEGVNALLVAARQKSGGRNGPFWVWGNEEPTEADATLFGFITSCLVCKAGPDSKKLVGGFPVVVEYARRIHDAFYPEYALWDSE